MSDSPNKERKSLAEDNGSMISKVYLVRYSSYGGDMYGESADANRVFLQQQDAKTFAKLSAQAYAARYYGRYGNPFENVNENENGEYRIHTECNGHVFRCYEHELEVPVQASELGEKVFSIERDNRIKRLLFGYDRPQAIKEANRFAQELSTNSPTSLCGHIDDFGADLVKVVRDVAWEHNRATYAVKLKTKKNPDESAYEDYMEDEDMLDDWFSQDLTQVQVLYTDIGPFEYPQGMETSKLNSEIATNWNKFMGGTSGGFLFR